MADAILIASGKGDVICFRAVKYIFPWPSSAFALLSWGSSCCGCEGFAGHSWSNWSSFGEVSTRGQAWERGESHGGVRIVLLALGSRPEPLKVSGLVLRQCCLQVERQLDLPSMAGRLRGVLVWFVWVCGWCRKPVLETRVRRTLPLACTLVECCRVRESRRLHVPLVARISLITESGRHHQQSKVLSCGALGLDSDEVPEQFELRKQMQSALDSPLGLAGWGRRGQCRGRRRGGRRRRAWHGEGGGGRCREGGVGEGGRCRGAAWGEEEEGAARRAREEEGSAEGAASREEGEESAARHEGRRRRVRRGAAREEEGGAGGAMWGEEEEGMAQLGEGGGGRCRGRRGGRRRAVQGVEWGEEEGAAPEGGAIQRREEGATRQTS
ncbi:hypothetical protein Taro_009844 [Colocasia esculenta]|uniref:Uncharacterized protein n=1 Tax=Colocasia esculenta TaxID=4460 RepID=A0A843U609_COLES|nr:hypothetical protein [Colocasia esculenta]